MPKQTGRDGAIELVAAAAAAFGTAADAVDAAVAQKLGVNRTDLVIIGAIHADGEITAGEAAKAARVSPAATSTAIQRLVTAGLIRRQEDPHDRRRARLVLTRRCARVLDDAYGPIEARGKALLQQWSEAELATIESFLQVSVRFQHEEAARIRGYGQ